MKKITLLTTGIALSMFSQLASAYCGVPPGILPPAIPPSTPKMTMTSSPTFYPTAHMWTQCFASIEGHSFSGKALQDLDETQMLYIQKYHMAIIETDEDSTKNKIQVLDGANKALIKVLVNDHAAIGKARSQMKTALLESELEHLRTIQEAKMNEKHNGLFTGKNGKNGIVEVNTPSYKYFKGVCKRDRMGSEITSEKYKGKKSRAITKEIMSTTENMLKQTGNSNAVAVAKIKNHNSLYCSAGDIKYGNCSNPELKICDGDKIDSGVCLVSNNEVFEQTNKDQSATNFLEPDGFNGRYTYSGEELEAPTNRIEDELFDIRYTYTPDQAQAAQAYSNNIVFQSGVKAPTSKEKLNSKNIAYLNEYNRYMAQLNIANLSFQESIASRQPVTTGEINMSEIDIIRYVIHNLQDADQIAAAMSGKRKTQLLTIYQIQTVQNKLKFMMSEQEERIEMLMATLVAQNANSPAVINDINSIK